jgi:hypothetical protein
MVMYAAPFGFRKVVFLSHVIDDGGPVFPGDPPVACRRPEAGSLSEDSGSGPARAHLRPCSD